MKTAMKIIVLLTLAALFAACQPAPTRYLTEATAAPTTYAPTAIPTRVQASQPTPDLTAIASSAVFELAGEWNIATVWVNGRPMTRQDTVMNGTQQMRGDEFAQLFNAVWNESGWLSQPYLPHESVRQNYAFEMSITLPAGLYTFNGVICELRLDESRNGRGMANPIAQTINGLPVENGNELQFRVSPVQTTDPGIEMAWGMVMCDANLVNGFSILRLGD